jgi:Ni/Fe-hydrogenase subunit HybB-like protein
VAAAFFLTICSLFFPVSELSPPAIMGVSLRSIVRIFTPLRICFYGFVTLSFYLTLCSMQAYMVLSESVEHHSGNQRKLRDPKMLGG